MAESKRRFIFRPLPGLTVAFVLSLIFLVGLGNWQLERREWKLQIIEDMHNRLSTPAQALPSQPEWAHSLEAMEWQPIAVEGTFLHDKEVHYLSGYNHAGYLVLTPLVVENGAGKAIVFVARGDVPKSLKQIEDRPAGSQPEGIVKLVGYMRRPETLGLMDFEEDRAANIWFTLDLERMISFTNLPDLPVAPFYLMAMNDADIGVALTPGQMSKLNQTYKDASVGPWPKRRPPTLEIKNDHLNYALTWLGLALVLVVIYFAYHKAQGRIGFVEGE
ncbi:MAG: surfeit locus 1 family protein [Parvibaculaceae bacterium]|jgi:surfeit locus 1 family protein